MTDGIQTISMNKHTKKSNYPKSEFAAKIGCAEVVYHTKGKSVTKHCWAPAMVVPNEVS